MPTTTEIAKEISNLVSLKKEYNSLREKREALEAEIATIRDAKHEAIDAKSETLSEVERKDAHKKVHDELVEIRAKSQEMKVQVNVLSAKFCGQRRKVRVLLQDAGIDIQEDLNRD